MRPTKRRREFGEKNFRLDSDDRDEEEEEEEEAEEEEAANDQDLSLSLPLYHPTIFLRPSHLLQKFHSFSGLLDL